MSSQELAWLASALRQPGYKLPGHDENGEPVSGATIRLALDLGLIEPWLPLPGESVPKVCRLTQKGELLAESFLLGGERSLGEVREIAQAFEEEQDYDRVGLDEILDEEDDEESGKAWWEALPEEISAEDERLLATTQPRTAPKRQKRSAGWTESPPPHGEERQPRRRRFTPEERHEALRILREGVQNNGLPSPSRFAFATAKLAAGVSLMAVGFLLGWSIDPPFTRLAEPDRVRIAIDQGTVPAFEPSREAPQDPGRAPSVDEILSISPSAGPATPAPESEALQPPIFAAPIERGPTDVPQPSRDPGKVLPPLMDPDLLEKWDRAELELGGPAEHGTTLALAEGPPKPLMSKPLVPEPLVIERIPLSTGTPLRSAGSFAVEMAAYNSASQARSASATLETRHADLLAGLPLEVRKEQVVPLGEVYRIKSGPLTDQGAAERLCASLRARGQDCFVVTLPPAQ
jgi:hypothetical protein